jgi:DNA adenine methylase
MEVIKMKLYKPFLKWAGGKIKILPKLIPYFDNSEIFVEPFCGSGSVWLNTDYKKYIIADINEDLINLYKTLKKEQSDFINYCYSFFNNSNNQECYYKYRNNFNSTSNIKEKSALFIYLNRHCFNGLCRYNSSGKFNVPYGKYNTIYFPRKEMEFFAEKSKKVKFLCEDFNKVFKITEKLDDCIIYCDPPYIPISNTSNFTSYSKDIFNQERQEQLYHYIINSKHRVVVSNSTKAKSLYSKLEIIEIDVRRNISSKGESRKKIKEIIAIKEKII